jgi:hypothetical protein
LALDEQEEREAMSQYIRVTLLRCRFPHKLQSLLPSELEASDIVESVVAFGSRAILTVLPTPAGTGFPGEQAKIGLPIGEFSVKETFEDVLAKLDEAR